MIDPNLIAQQAARTNLTPAVIWAIGQQRNAFSGDPFAQEIAARGIANELAHHVAEHGSIEKALSALKTGDPNAYDSPTHPAAGYVSGVLGLAGSQPTYGLDNFQPADPAAFHAHATDTHQVLDGLAELGGVVTHEGVAALGAAIQQHAPAPNVSHETQQRPKPPTPSGPKPQDVAEFQQHASSLGIDPEHFSQHFGFASSMSRKLMGKGMTLEEYAPMALMDRTQMQQHIRATPHPTYPEITVGQYHDAYNQAALQSWKAGYMPHPSEAARFASLGHDPKQIAAYYQDQADAKTAKEGKPPASLKTETSPPESPSPKSTAQPSKPTVIQGGVASG